MPSPIIEYRTGSPYRYRVMYDNNRGLCILVFPRITINPRGAPPKSEDRWDVKTLAKWYKDAALPEGPVRLDACTVIEDVPRFVSTHLEVATAKNGLPAFRVFYDRLINFKSVIFAQAEPEKP